MDLWELVKAGGDFVMASLVVLAWWAVVIIFGLGVGQ